MRYKDKYIAALLAFLFGGLGIHRFYLGHVFSGILYILFCWTFIPLLLSFIEFFYYLLIPKSTFDRRYNAEFLSAQAAYQAHLMMAQQRNHLYEPSFDGECGGEPMETRNVIVRETESKEK